MGVKKLNCVHTSQTIDPPANTFPLTPKKSFQKYSWRNWLCFKSELEVTCVEKCRENWLKRVLAKLHILSSLRPCRICASDQSYMFEGCVSNLTSVMHSLWSGGEVDVQKLNCVHTLPFGLLRNHWSACKYLPLKRLKSHPKSMPDGTCWRF